jgi:Protein of unknown function (DUF1566)
MKGYLKLIIYTTALLLLFVTDGSAKQEKRFVLLTSTGIVSDSKTGLEWKVGPDKDTNWDQARAWVNNLNLDGGGWRMPTLDELKGLYIKGASRLNMTPLLKTTGWQVWSDKLKDSSFAWGFYFTCGGKGWDGRTFPFDFRAFAVRSPRR